jgi:glyoxylase-like metal-dependent hydrolase (beta-lactamase superfamily II)
VYLTLPDLALRGSVESAMTLEDHLGDVLQKARLHAEVTIDEAARAAGLTVPELETIEAAGIVARPPAYPALASLLELDAPKLARLAEGWQPRPVDLNVWRELRAVSSSGAGYGVNSYLVWDEVTRAAALFDTGFDPAPVLALVAEHQLLLAHLFLTHGHADHAGGTESLRQRFPRLRVHSSAPNVPPEQRNRPHEFVQLGSLRIGYRATPGHTQDGATYVIGNWPEDAPFAAMVGDALFAGSMGRAVGNAPLARQKVREQILSLPPATLVCPGHGPLTTVAEEREHNPFF